ncbi:metallophosphoesterase [Psychrobium sp. 1_MG-2023]|uniref:metallophosphoesterase n=1 Tax=Psychrobium sp. 1_MG-2023 TaxID=3062624 RepID=UPI000C343D9E|nr:metallophosphoesterase [Psychrobium sp. 1_MG-2023]MDP2560191.1 metallophosphoesterase [Psychrobium sp. 1_MG-2023]PKF57002.1 metallophosphoesterase [Alteromonadales bacterium alter-6D02]
MRALLLTFVSLFILSGCSESLLDASGKIKERTDSKTHSIDRFDDGPYLLFDGAEILEYNIKQNRLSVMPFHGVLTINDVVPSTNDTYQGVSKIAAISDIHGQVGIFKQLLKANGIVDAQYNWRWGQGHLVITGDIFDRGDTVTEALWLVYKLEQQAIDAGGKVHYLLGNHEYMVLRGDERYIHPKYAFTLKAMDMSLKQLFNDDSVLGRWLRTKSTVININGYVFLHGGIHQDYLDLKLSLEQTNALFRQSIGYSKAHLKQQPTTATLFGRTGPIWYRGFFKDDTLSQASVEQLLKQLGAHHIVVGHTSQEKIETRFSQRILAIDTSIKRGEKGELLIIKDAAKEEHHHRLLRGSLNGVITPLVQS